MSDDTLPTSPALGHDDAPRWRVGLDLRPRSHGAARFAAWLHERDPSIHLDGVHLVDASLLELPDSGARVQLVDRARRAAEAALESLGVREHYQHVHALVTTDVVRALAVSGGLSTVTGLIVGRRAGGEERALVRLGRICRRLLRRAESPVFVVPPDLEPAHLGAGPIVCAVTPEPASLAAARYAMQLGKAIDRPVLYIQAIALSVPMGLPYVPESAWVNLHEQHMGRSQETLAQWCDKNGLEGEQKVISGPVVYELIATARRLDGCMIVCGSRQLSTAERLWTASTGMGLAAGSHLPVAIVPPEE